MALLLGIGDFGLGAALANVPNKPPTHYASVAAALADPLKPLTNNQIGYVVTVAGDDGPQFYFRVAGGLHQLTTSSLITTDPNA